ncbi:hypothetical protein ACOJQI_19705 [Bacillus salacetis]
MSSKEYYRNPKSIKYSIWDTKTDKSHEFAGSQREKKENPQSNEKDL